MRFNMKRLANNAGRLYYTKVKKKNTVNYPG